MLQFWMSAAFVLEVVGLTILFVGLIFVRDPRRFRPMVAVGALMVVSAIVIMLANVGMY